jgi:hypothetical protein
MINWIECNLPFYTYEPRVFPYPWDEEFYNKIHKLKCEKFGEEIILDFNKSIWHGNEDQEKLFKEICDFEENLPEVINRHNQIEKDAEEFDKIELSKIIDSFCSLGLNKPGTLIQLENNSNYLIGDINKDGVIKSYGSDFGDDMIPHLNVIKYAILFDYKNII